MISPGRDPATFRNVNVGAKVTAALKKRLQAEADRANISLSEHLSNILGQMRYTLPADLTRKTFPITIK